MNNTGNKRAPTTATQRLKQDYLRIKKDPVPYICAEPLPSNILEWYGPTGQYGFFPIKSLTDVQ